MSLIVWGDSEEATLYFWTQLIHRVQNRPNIAISTTTTPVSGLPGDIPNDGASLEDLLLWGNPSLPHLNEFSFLSTFTPDFLPSPNTDPQGYSVNPFWQTESSEGGLGVRILSPLSSGTLSSSLPPCTAACVATECPGNLTVQ